MATTILQSFGRGQDCGQTGRCVDVTQTVNITHNNSRLVTVAGVTYERAGTDASGNAVYRNNTRVRI